MSEVDIRAIKIMIGTMTRDAIDGLSITGKSTGSECVVVDDKLKAIAKIQLAIYPV